MENPFLLDENNALLAKVYCEPNYRIRDISDRKKCLLCFSGNGLYYPNDAHTFEDIVIKNDRYEWTGVTSDRRFREAYGKIVYIRNIYKNWYINGISRDICNVKKLIEWCREITEGYEVYVLGSSAGGYIATIIGSMIGAKAIFNFSGQTNLWKHRALTEYWVNKSAENPVYNKYFNVTDFLNPDVPVFYFCPIWSDEDMIQGQFFQNFPNVYTFRIESKEHGATLLRENFKYILTKDVSEMVYFHKVLGDCSYSPEGFFAKTGGAEGIYHLLLCKEKRLEKKLKRLIRR